MSDLISRKWLIECVEEGWIKFDTEKDKNKFIHLVRDTAPSVDVQPVRHGKWEKDPRSKRTRCSECYSVVPRDDYRRECLSDYCSVCGARMDGEQDG